MTRRLPDLEAWAIFAKVAEHASFSRAARELGLSDPTVSKAIGRIETRLGVTLIARTSRRVSLTDAGRAALTRAARILSEGEAIEEEAGEQAAVPRGRVRVSAPLSFGIGYLGATLPGFLAAYPEIVVDFALSDRKVDLVAEGFDLALRVATLDDSSMLSRRLSTVRLLLVGAPSYFERHGRPVCPANLVAHRALGYSGSASRGVWRFSHPTAGEETAEPTFCVWSDNVDLMMPALLAGQGLAIQPEFMVWRELREGRLVTAMPDWSVDPLGLHLVMPASPLRPLRVQVLIDYLARELAHTPWARR
ncbi:LysR family transcriptional regulator [Gluconacetobacter sacchari]|uniref:LysR family transcriptional regulator n=2 Tax=Gluconacetobacter sacchari TaxID=92759 RepID=A0A7W4IH88_9PROT|nr:LysR family transcriptional regulator [Gluconacetobacter sacchari]MBB2162864.1 LysR family transcriptional regulator [Gluconacetobacter sacchari]GBQ28396.1 LysR family transcriptional regulator [Gluconacetobacter sacchari DSM 12717]